MQVVPTSVPAQMAQGCLIFLVWCFAETLDHHKRNFSKFRDFKEQNEQLPCVSNCQEYQQVNHQLVASSNLWQVLVSIRKVNRPAMIAAGEENE